MISKKNINILVFNCGSSSLKYKIFNMPSQEILLYGEAERIGTHGQKSSMINHYIGKKKERIKTILSDHNEAFKKVMVLIKRDGKLNKAINFDIFAHRYVHPGNSFRSTTLVTKPVLKKLRKTLDLAPIHNGISYKMIALCSEKFKKKPQLIVFDSTFHSTIPQEFSTYAIPEKLRKKYNLKKIGFHGISHKYIMQEACRFVEKPVNTQKIISCHLGTGGSSVCAIDKGKSINNSMGFTPLEGLMMNTRCGDLDPGTVFYLMSKENLSIQETEEILNYKSGILGILKFSSDLRDAIEMINKDQKAKMAFDMYSQRVKKYVFFYSLLLQKPDIIVFTDSLGVLVPLLREKICSSLKFMDIEIDKVKNNNYNKGTVEISTPSSQTKIFILPTDEEVMIAREAYKEYTHGNNN